MTLNYIDCLVWQVFFMYMKIAIWHNFHLMSLKYISNSSTNKRFKVVWVWCQSLRMLVICGGRTPVQFTAVLTEDFWYSREVSQLLFFCTKKYSRTFVKKKKLVPILMVENLHRHSVPGELKSQILQNKTDVHSHRWVISFAVESSRISSEISRTF